MPKYKVNVAVSYLKDLTIYADCEDEAEEKAEDIVHNWSNVHEVEVLNVEEE